MKRERPELSKKSLYHIPKHRYYELKHFCLQYEGWKNALTLIDFWEAAPIDMTGVIKGHSPESSTERKALARLYYLNGMDIVDRCVEELDTVLAPYVKKGVTLGLGYEKLLAQGCPCCRDIYYEYYRYFFWLLSKERQ